MNPTVNTPAVTPVAETPAKATKKPAKAKATKKATAKAKVTKKGAKGAAKAKATAKGAAKAKPESKKAQAMAMLKKGVAIDTLMDKFGWQRHTVRGFMSIVSKTTPVTSEQVNGKLVYKLA